MSDEARQELVERTARNLSEHFESVVILATGTGSDGCTRMHTGNAGNFYASLGAAQEFCDKNAARVHNHVRKTE